MDLSYTCRMQRGSNYQIRLALDREISELFESWGKGKYEISFQNWLNLIIWYPVDALANIWGIFVRKYKEKMVVI